MIQEEYRNYGNNCFFVKEIKSHIFNTMYFTNQNIRNTTQSRHDFFYNK